MSKPNWYKWYRKECADERRRNTKQLRHRNAEVLRQIVGGHVDVDEFVMVPYRGTEGWLSH